MSAQHGTFTCEYCGDEGHHDLNGHICDPQELLFVIEGLKGRVKELEAQDQWIPVDGAKEVPVGDWLFLLEDGKQHTGNVHENVTVIGGLFFFDQPKAVAYMPLPPPPQEKDGE